MIYYSPTGGFYSSKLHGGNIPDDAIEITESKYHELLSEQGLGKSIKAGPDGLPVAVEPPGPTDEQIMSKERAWRDAELASVMWLRERHRDQQEIGGSTTLSSDQFAELLVYMQALRDWPQTSEFPDSLYRPVPPSWIAQQVD
jgi:hypothetical protein